MKVLIVTVAGMSGRFSKSLGYPCLKCLFSEGGIEESLLYRMLHHNCEFDCYVVVGGFMYEELELAVAGKFQESGKKIMLVKNEHYADYGSGYSLYLALEKIMGMDFDEVVFAEGDLYVDENTFRKIYEADGNVITCNQEAILADKAVAFYFDLNDGVHYIYDSGHCSLEIREPFLGIFNSGQVWKFADKGHVRQSFRSMGEKEWQGTNLAFVQRYFGTLGKDDYEIITFEEWVNCNTISDYRKIKGY